MSKTRLLYIDQARGLCILFVIIGHVYALDNPFFSLIYGTNVTLFFMLTGYVFGLKNNDISVSAQFKGNIKKIFIPYIIYSILIFIWQLIRFYCLGFGSYEELRANIVDTITLYGISSMWFLSTLFISKTVFAVVVKLLNDNKLFYILLCIFILICVCACIMCLPYLEVQSEPVYKIFKRLIKIFTRALQALAFIIYGFLLCKLEIKLKNAIKLNRRYILVCIITFILAIFGFVINGITDFNTLQFANIWLYNICPVLIFPGILLLCKQIRVREVLCLLGEYSLMIMATHLVFLSMAQIICYYITAKTGIAAIYWKNGCFVFVIILESVLIMIRECLRKRKSKG